jgi:LPXTG-motif cell wall-anchored protein
MLEKWRSFMDTVNETTSAIRWASGVVIVLAGLYTAFGKWFSSLATGQQIAFWVVIGGLVLIGVTFILDWRRKRSIDTISDLLGIIDQLTLEYIDEFSPIVGSAEDSDGIARILGLNVRQLRIAVDQNDEKQIEQEYEKVLRQYDKFLNPKKRMEETQQDLLLVSAYLNARNIGLQQITDTQKYHRLRNRVKALQKMVPSAAMNMKINEYWRWSEGLYCILLTTKPMLLAPAIGKKVPPKVIASATMIRPRIEEATTLFSSAVHESIETYKERHKEKTNKDKDKKKS